MWFCVCVTIVLCTKVFATPLHNGNSKFASGFEQSQNSLLISIEDRLHNLEVFYTMHLSPIIEGKLQQHNRKLDALDSKLIKLETLITINLEKISENISNKNYKDDMARTNTFRKIDAVYEGITHRLNYIERKSENFFMKTQNLIEISNQRLEKIDQRNIDLETGISDTIFAIDDLKTAQTFLEQNILSTVHRNLNATNNFITILNTTSKEISHQFHGVKEELHDINKSIEFNLASIQNNTDSLRTIQSELKVDLNAYANKVADMNSDVWKMNELVEEALKGIEIAINVSHNKIEHSLTKKLSEADFFESFDENQFHKGQNKFTELQYNLENYFGKIIANQEIFLDNCHRLQMDEAQIENEISEILKKLINIVDQKNAVNIDDIKNLEKLIKNHDNHIYRNLYQANTNVVSLFDKTARNDLVFENDFKEVIQQLDKMLNLLQTFFANHTANFTAANVEIAKEIKSVEERITESLAKLKSEDLKKILSEIQENNQLIDYIKQNYITNSTLVPENQTETLKTNNEDQEDKQKLIELIFSKDPNFKPINSTDSVQLNNNKTCKPNYLNLIDVRSGNNNNCEEPVETTTEIEGSTTNTESTDAENPTTTEIIYQIDIRAGTNPSNT